MIRTIHSWSLTRTRDESAEHNGFFLPGSRSDRLTARRPRLRSGPSGNPPPSALSRSRTFTVHREAPEFQHPFAPFVSIRVHSWLPCSSEFRARSSRNHPKTPHIPRHSSNRKKFHERSSIRGKFRNLNPNLLDARPHLDPRTKRASPAFFSRLPQICSPNMPHLASIGARDPKGERQL
jgi:hypothetical protein